MSKRSSKLRAKIGWRTRLKRWLFWLGFGWLLLSALQLIGLVRWVPDYRGGHAYVSYSPDGHYKISNIFPPEKEGERVFFLVSSWPENKPLAIYPVPYDWTAGFRDFWLCKDVGLTSGEFCYGYMMAPPTYFPNISLPPDLWHRLATWVFFSLHPWQDEKLEERPMHPKPLHYCANGLILWKPSEECNPPEHWR